MGGEFSAAGTRRKRGDFATLGGGREEVDCSRF